MHADGWFALIPVPLFALFSWRVHAVSRSGAIAGLVVGLMLAFGLGWAGFVILLTMVGLGTITSERSGRQRDAWQVLCNGGVAAVFGVFGFGAAAAGALAAALSDTASSELGRRYGGRPRRLLFGAPMDPGRDGDQAMDGGMSWLGTIIGMLFAWPVPLVAWWLGALDTFAAASAVAAAGMSGNLVDSILGSSLQAKLGPRGNDIVNGGATLTGGLLGFLLATG